MLEKRGKNTLRGKIILSVNNSKVHRGIVADIIKLGVHIQDRGTEIA